MLGQPGGPFPPDVHEPAAAQQSLQPPFRQVGVLYRCVPVLRIPPVTTMSTDDAVRWVATTLQRYLLDD